MEMRKSSLSVFLLCLVSTTTIASPDASCTTSEPREGVTGYVTWTITHDVSTSQPFVSVALYPLGGERNVLFECELANLMVCTKSTPGYVLNYTASTRTLVVTIVNVTRAQFGRYQVHVNVMDKEPFGNLCHFKPEDAGDTPTTPAPITDGKSGGVSTGAIIGGSAGGLVVLLGIFVAILCWRRHRTGGNNMDGEGGSGRGEKIGRRESGDGHIGDRRETGILLTPNQPRMEVNETIRAPNQSRIEENKTNGSGVDVTPTNPAEKRRIWRDREKLTGSQTGTPVKQTYGKEKTPTWKSPEDEATAGPSGINLSGIQPSRVEHADDNDEGEKTPFLPQDTSQSGDYDSFLTSTPYKDTDKREGSYNTDVVKTEKEEDDDDKEGDEGKRKKMDRVVDKKEKKEDDDDEDEKEKEDRVQDRERSEEMGYDYDQEVDEKKGRDNDKENKDDDDNKNERENVKDDDDRNQSETDEDGRGSGEDFQRQNLQFQHQNLQPSEGGSQLKEEEEDKIVEKEEEEKEEEDEEGKIRHRKDTESSKEPTSMDQYSSESEEGEQTGLLGAEDRT